jgi:hypothetical protein
LTAHSGVFIYEYDVAAMFGCLDGCGHASRACTDDEDLDIDVNRRMSNEGGVGELPLSRLHCHAFSGGYDTGSNARDAIDAHKAGGAFPDAAEKPPGSFMGDAPGEYLDTMCV